MGIGISTGLGEEAMAEIANLSPEEKINLISFLSTSLIESRQPSQPAYPSAKDAALSPDRIRSLPYYRGGRTAAERSEAERVELLNDLAGSWSDMPDDVAEKVIGARTISTREVNLDD